MRYFVACFTEWHSHVTIYSKHDRLYKSPNVGHRNAVTQNRDTETLHTKFHTMNIMRSGARPIKQSISRACRNHAFGIHESRQGLVVVIIKFHVFTSIFY